MPHNIKSGAADYMGKVYETAISDVQRTEVERAFFAGVFFCLTKLSAAGADASTAVGLYAECRAYVKEVTRRDNESRWDELQRRRATRRETEYE